MQVLGDLIKLPEITSDLPLPWWHRSPLGFLHGTDVFVAVLDRGKRPVGDIIVSVLDPWLWHNTLRLECQREDEPGVIADLLSTLRGLNIALGEAVTVETGRTHSACFICEVQGGRSVKEYISRIRADLTQRHFSPVQVDEFETHPLPIKQAERTRVDHGWLRELPWRGWLEKEFPNGVDRVDLRRAVVSADTDRRLLRFVFPRKGAQTVKIRHADKPGALLALSGALASCGLNVLSGLLRAVGAAAPGRAGGEGRRRGTFTAG
jgi:hypothetical protein